MTNHATDNPERTSPVVANDAAPPARAPERGPGLCLTRTGILPQLCITPAQMWSMTAEAAYYMAMRRGFAPGHELEDWLAAEEEVLSNLM